MNNLDTKKTLLGLGRRVTRKDGILFRAFKGFVDPGKGTYDPKFKFHYEKVFPTNPPQEEPAMTGVQPQQLKTPTALKGVSYTQMEIPKGKLNVDHTYQRPVNVAWVRSAVNNFSQERLGTLQVAKRASGELFILDGQQRHAASLKVPSIHALPCKVYEGLTEEQEAWIFKGLNENRRPVPCWDKVRAGAICGEPVDVYMVTLFDKLGVRGGKAGSKGLRSISRSRELIQRDWRSNTQSAPVFETALTLACQLCEAESLVTPISEELLCGLFTLQFKGVNYKGAIISISDTMFVRRAMKFGAKQLGIAAAKYGRGNDFWARGILDEMNYKLPMDARFTI